MFILYALNGGVWSAYAELKDRRNNYAERVKETAEIKAAQGKTESERNAALVLSAFVLEKKYYGKEYGKLVLRALRHFDEVGLSNDIHASLEELLDEGCDAFALARSDENVAEYENGVFTVTV